MKQLLKVDRLHSDSGAMTNNSRVKSESLLDRLHSDSGAMTNSSRVKSESLLRMCNMYASVSVYLGKGADQGLYIAAGSG